MAFNDGEYSWSTLTPKFTHLADPPFNASCDTKINETGFKGGKYKVLTAFT